MVIDCLFCKIVKGEIPSWKIFEDENFLAILDPFPSIEGQIIVIPKKHVAEDIWRMESSIRTEFLDVVNKVVDRIKTVLNVRKVALVFEGEEVPHVHAKLFPMHDPKGSGKAEKGYYGEYPGFLDTRSGPRMDDKKLDELRERLKFPPEAD